MQKLVVKKAVEFVYCPTDIQLADASTALGMYVDRYLKRPSRYVATVFNMRMNRKKQFTLSLTLIVLGIK